MAVYKHGSSYWYEFCFGGKRIRENTRQGDRRRAERMEAAHRERVENEARERKRIAAELGCDPRDLIRCAECERFFDERKAVASDEGRKFCSDQCWRDWSRRQVRIPTLGEFIRERFEPWASATFEATSPKTWAGWYRPHLTNLRECVLASRRIDEITSEHIAEFAACELKRERRMTLNGRAGEKARAKKRAKKCGLQTASVNSCLRVLRRVMRKAVEWGLISNAPRIELLRGERHRERVLTLDEERSYLAATAEPLTSIATVLADTGMRPDECFRLRWEAITWEAAAQYPYGALLVTHGKTRAARRVLPLTPRVRQVLEQRWTEAGQPHDGWVWPAQTQSGHVESSTLKKQHRRALRESKVRPFVLYIFRHTFLTRLGMNGCDPWRLAYIAGHSSIEMSKRYVHPGAENVLAALTRSRAVSEQPTQAALPSSVQ